MEKVTKNIIAQQIFAPSEVSGATTEFDFVLKNKNIKERFDCRPVIYNGKQGFLGRKAIAFYKNKLKKIRPDLVVIRGAGPDGYYAVLGAKKAKCKKILVGIHGLYTDITTINPIKKLLIRFFVENSIFKKCTSFYTVCDDAYISHKFLHRFHKKYLGTVYNPMPCLNHRNIVALNNVNKNKTKKTGIYIGRLTNDKGVMVLANALKLLFKMRNDFDFIFVGSGEQESAIKDVLCEEISKKRVRMLGARNDVLNLLLSSDFFVFPSLRENHPFSILEAVSSGIFIISTNVGGIKETIDEYENRIYISPSSISSTVDGVACFLDYHKNYTRFTKTQAEIAERFSEDNVSYNLIKLYEKAIAK